MNANENAENELMARMKVSKAVATMAIPSVISSLVTVVYNMADTFFVGQTEIRFRLLQSVLRIPSLFYLWRLQICLAWAAVLWHLWHLESRIRSV